MDVASVTLDEVLKAAQLRAASLVPETSGYLALAIADASARLPFRIEDDMVNLSTEGTVKVLRGTDVVQPEESAAILRDVLDRLLGCSIGSMPGLANASRTRPGRETVLDVIGDLENALVPVNRSAARRALARLARETVRARDRGKLDKPIRSRSRSVRPPPRDEAPPPPAPAPAPIPPPAPVVAAPAVIAPPVVVAPPVVAAPTPQVVVPVAPSPVEVAVAMAAEMAVEVDVVFTDPPTPVDAIAPAPVEPTPTIVASTVEDALVDQRLDELPHALRLSADVAAPAPAPMFASTSTALGERRRPKRERADDSPKSTVDQLLASFTVSALALPEDAAPIVTPPPPRAAKSAPSAASAPRAAAARRSLAPAVEEPTPSPRVAETAGAALALAPTAPARFGAQKLVLLVAALLVAGLLGHFGPRLF